MRFGGCKRSCKPCILRVGLRTKVKTFLGNTVCDVIQVVGVHVSSISMQFEHNISYTFFHIVFLRTAVNRALTYMY